MRRLSFLSLSMIFFVAVMAAEARDLSILFAKMVERSACNSGNAAGLEIARIATNEELAAELVHPDRAGCVARILGKRGPKAASAVPALIEALRSPSQGTRYYSAVALGQIGPEAESAIEPLMKADGTLGEGFFQSPNLAFISVLNIGGPKAREAIKKKRAHILVQVLREGETQLTKAVRNNDVDRIRLYSLIGNDADNLIDELNAEGDSAYEIAYFEKEQTMAKSLAKAGASRSFLKKNYNSLGFKEYEKKNYSRAAELFRRATVTNPKNAVAFYNLACARSLLHTQAYEDPLNRLAADNPADFTNQTLSALDSAIRLDPRRKSKALLDIDLESLRNTVYFEILSGKLHPENDEELKSSLLRHTWISDNTCGDSAYYSGLKFQKDGRVFGGCNNSGEQKIVGVEFRVANKTVFLKTPQGKERIFLFHFDGIEGHLKEQGTNKETWHERDHLHRES